MGPGGLKMGFKYRIISLNLITKITCGSFTCADGRCVDISKRCNSINDSNDWSDENKELFLILFSFRKDLKMSGPTELMQYTIKNWIMEETATGVVVTLVLGRKILNEILTTYLPTSLLIIIVHSTNYYKDFFFEAIVTVNLTGVVFKIIQFSEFCLLQVCLCCPPCL